jgi:hypothetical protein
LDLSIKQLKGKTLERKCARTGDMQLLNTGSAPLAVFLPPGEVQEMTPVRFPQPNPDSRGSSHEEKKQSVTG